MAVAVYWDFENVHAALIDGRDGPGAYRASRYKPQAAVMQIGKVMDYVATVGDVFLNRAYANWQWLARYRDELLMYSIDLIQLFPRGMYSKNGADIRLALDALEDCLRFGHVEQVVIISGDSDYISLAQKVQQLGKTVIGIGVEDATNDFWIKSCNEFKYYGTLLAKIESAVQVPAALLRERDPVDARTLLLRALGVLTVDRNEEWVNKAKVRPTIKRLDPSFDETSYGYANFSALLDACDDAVRTRRGEYDHQLALAGVAAGPSREEMPETTSGAGSACERYESLLKKQGVHLGTCVWRSSAVNVLHGLLQPTRSAGPILTWPMFDDCLAKWLAASGENVDVATAKKFRHLVFKAGILRLGPQGITLTAGLTPAAMEQAIARMVISRIMQTVDEPLPSRPLHELLYGPSAAPVDLEQLIAEVRKGLETANDGLAAE